MSPLSTFLDGRAPTRGIAWLSLSETGNVLKHSVSSDSGGGQTESYAQQSSVPCRIDPLGGAGIKQGEVAGRISDRSNYLITLPAGTEITLDDDFQITGVGRFEITALRLTTSEFLRQVEATDRV